MGVYKRGKVWYYRIRHKGKLIRKVVGPQKRQAELAYQKKKVELSEGKLPSKPKKEILFRDLAKLYMELYSIPHKKSFVRDEISINHINTFMGDWYVSQITPLMIERYKSDRMRKVSKATVNREMACLKTIFSKGIEWEKIDHNPSAKVKFFKEKGKRLRFFSINEIHQILDTVPNHQKPIVRVALYTGLRRGNILDLKWKDIDFKHHILFVDNPKGSKALKLPMNPHLIATLKSIGKHPKSPYVFCDRDGKPYKRLEHGFNTALKKLGIKDATFHTLRHTFASHMVMRGHPLKTVATLMGHSTVAMVDEVYGHLSPGHLQASINDIGELFGGGIKKEKPHKEAKKYPKKYHKP